MNKLKLTIVAYVFCTITAAKAVEQVIYTTDFSSGIDSEWTNGSTSTNSNVGTYSGDYTLSGSTTLIINDLPPHTEVVLEFDLYLFNTWDGENLTYGKDYFSLSGDVTGSWTFTNHQAEGQTYPGSPDEVYGSGSSATHVYRGLDPTGTGDQFIIDHTGDTFSVTFGGPTTQSDEQWGIDNVRVIIDGSIVSATLEPVQAVVNTKTFDLVAEKDLVVRIFPTIDLPLFPEFEALARVCPEYNSGIDICYSGWLENTGYIYAEDYDFDTAEYLAGEDSIDIPIRAEAANLFLTAGTHTFKAELYEIIPEGNELVWEETKNYTFLASKSIRILTIPILYHYNGAAFPISQGWPDDALLDAAHTNIQAAYPVDEDSVINIVYNREFVDLESFTGDLSTWPDRRTLVIKTSQIRATQRLEVPRGDIFYAAAVLPAKTQDGNKTMPYLGYTYPALRNVVVTVDKSNVGIAVIASTLAHEVGHQLGLGDEYCFTGLYCAADAEYPDNSPPQNADEGNKFGRYIKREMHAFDSGIYFTGKTTVFNSATTPMYGYMGGGDDTNSWTGNLEYEHLFPQLTTLSVAEFFSTATLTEANVTAIAARDVIHITGEINKNDTATLSRLLIVNSTAAIPKTEGGEFSLEFSDGSTILSDINFGIEFTVETLEEATAGFVEQDQVPFSITTELPFGTSVVRLLKSGVALVSINRSAHVPVIDTVSIAYPDAETANISWTGSDVDNDPLTYTVIYSPDGVEKIVITALTPNTAVSINLLSSPPQPEAFILIKVSDGFNTAERQELLNISTGIDPYLLKQYNTRGPNLSGMCSTTHCVKTKIHTLVGKNLSDQVLTVNFSVMVNATPDASCTVNGAFAGEVVTLASAININPGSHYRLNSALNFECNNLPSIIGQDFILTGKIFSTNILDVENTVNNEITKTQTVR